MSYVRFYSIASFTLGTNGNTKLWNGTATNAMEYSTDANTWSTWDGTSAISAGLSNGVYNLYLRGTGNTKVSNSTSPNNVVKFTFNGTDPIDSEGNIESLLDYATVDNNQHPTMDTYAFTSLFYDQILLKTTPTLPATTLTNHCYNGMFRNCTSLTTAPSLPATTLANSCYSYMFYNCTSLQSAPELLATTLANNCYKEMFYGCTSLQSAPSLPATTLFPLCYYQMFRDCTSLITAPTLPATTLASNCYSFMFYNCTSLITPPALPATTLSYSCYNNMFRKCTSLTTAPALPAMTLTNNCYEYMFYDSGIKLSTTQHDDYTLAYRIPTEGTGTETNSLTNMFYGSGVNTPSINTTYYIKDIQYETNHVELGAIAQSIRNKNETSSLLTFPEDYVTAIGNIIVDVDNEYYISQAIPSDALGEDGDICVVYN